MSAELWSLGAAVTGGCVGVLTGLLVPDVLARLPEPTGEPAGEHVPEPVVADAPPSTEGRSGPDRRPGSELDTGLPPGASHAGVVAFEEPKEPYADMARLPRLRAKTATATGLVAALLGGVVGWAPALAVVLYLAPVGVALALVDWRTRLLPTRIVGPSYAVVAVLVLAGAAATGDWRALATAGWGWLVAGGTFFVLWFVHPRGMGYGDVRLAGVLGVALGFLGWGELLTGIYAGFLLGGVGGLLLAALRVVDRKAYPFGPFMLAGAVVGVCFGPAVAGWYG